VKTLETEFAGYQRSTKILQEARDAVAALAAAGGAGGGHAVQPFDRALVARAERTVEVEDLLARARREAESASQPKALREAVDMFLSGEHRGYASSALQKEADFLAKVMKGEVQPPERKPTSAIGYVAALRSSGLLEVWPIRSMEEGAPLYKSLRNERGTEKVDGIALQKKSIEAEVEVTKHKFIGEGKKVTGVKIHPLYVPGAAEPAAGLKAKGPIYSTRPNSWGGVDLLKDGVCIGKAEKGGMHSSGIQLIDWIPAGDYPLFERDGGVKLPKTFILEVKRALGVE
jgi:hypothetical protein